MKSKITLKLFALAALVLSFSACKKDSNTPKPPITEDGPYTSVMRAYDEAAPAAKSFTFAAEAGANFYGASGTRYQFPARAFQDAAGNVVTGNVTVEVREFVSEGDMLFGRMLTVSNEQNLISAGSFSVKASKDGSPVYMRPYMKYKVGMPTNKGAATAGMQYFSGAPVTSAAAASSVVNWLPRIDSLEFVVYDGDTINVFPDSLGMVNLDKFDKSSIVSIDLKIAGVSGSLAATDVLAYCVYDGLLSVTPLRGGTFASNTFSGVSVAGVKSHYVVCLVSGGDFYGGILKSTTPVGGSTYTVTVAKTDPKTFKAAVDAL